MSIIDTQGLVLKYTNINDADRILTILTKDKGKIKVFAKGCRRPKSRLISSCEVFAFSEFILYKGTNFYHINNCELRESFYALRKDLLALSYAVYFAELTDTVTDEDMNCKNIFLLLARTLYYLSKKEIPLGILSNAFQIKLLDLSGLRPSLKRCASCGKEGSFVLFNINLGGIICENCSQEVGTISINSKTIEFLKTLLVKPVSSLNSIKIDNTIFIEADRIIFEFLQLHMDKRFKSMIFINNIKNFETN